MHYKIYGVIDLFQAADGPIGARNNTTVRSPTRCSSFRTRVVVLPVRLARVVVRLVVVTFRPLLLLSFSFLAALLAFSFAFFPAASLVFLPSCGYVGRNSQKNYDKLHKLSFFNRFSRLNMPHTTNKLRSFHRPHRMGVTIAKSASALWAHPRDST